MIGILVHRRRRAAGVARDIYAARQRGVVIVTRSSGVTERQP